MQLTLVVPGLLDLADAEPDRADTEGAALARLLATGLPPAVHDGAIGIACTALGVAKQRDWPVAPLLAAAANLDPGAAYWLLAEPVSLLVGQLDVRLRAVVDDLSQEDAAALLATLNAHFAGDGLSFTALDPARWLIAAAEVPQLATHPVDDAFGAPIVGWLPEGPDAARWRRWQTEMQMLMFGHPAVFERERQGRLPVNGIWLSGGGVRASAQPTPRIAALYADAPLPRDLARACGVPVAPAPPSLGAWLAAGPKSPSLLWLPSIGDDHRSSTLAAFERDWAQPIGAALAARADLDVGIALCGRGRAWLFAPRRRSLVARWRERLTPLASLSTQLAALAR